jgi:hypothetical protein
LRAWEVPVVADPGDQRAADVVGRDHVRVSHADREHVIEMLKAAFVQDRLTKDELDTRVGQAFTSRTYAELAAVTADLPVPARPIAAQPPRAVRAQGERRVLRSGTVFMAATAIYAGALLVALSLLRDRGGESPAGDNLILLSSWLYMLVLVILYVRMCNSLERRGRLEWPGRGGRGLEGGRPGSTGRDPALPGARPDQPRPTCGLTTQGQVDRTLPGGVRGHRAV